mgnify:CR=1 FL=1
MHPAGHGVRYEANRRSARTYKLEDRQLLPIAKLEHGFAVELRKPESFESAVSVNEAGRHGEWAERNMEEVVSDNLLSVMIGSLERGLDDRPTKVGHRNLVSDQPMAREAKITIGGFCRRHRFAGLLESLGRAFDGGKDLFGMLGEQSATAAETTATSTR